MSREWYNANKNNKNHDKSIEVDKKREAGDMDTLSIFIQQNKGKIMIVPESNIIRNNEGKIVLSKDDEWRDEEEWEILTKL